jgi:hypothetical protein
MDTSLLPIGSHLVIRRPGYTHHGIYAGAGRVIHYAGFKRLLRRGPVEEIALHEFTRGRDVEIRAAVAPAYTGEQAVGRARSRLGESRYRLWSNNCEHFVEWCVSGTSRSAQVEALRARLARAFGLRPLARRAPTAALPAAAAALS